MKLIFLKWICALKIEICFSVFFKLPLHVIFRVSQRNESQLRQYQNLQLLLWKTVSVWNAKLKRWGHLVCICVLRHVWAIFQLLKLINPLLQVKPAPIKAVPVPHSVPFQPKLPAKSVVEMCPFSFEERERERRAMKEKKLEELRKEEVMLNAHCKNLRNFNVTWCTCIFL